MDEHINHPLVKASVAAGAYVSIEWLDFLTTAGKVCAALTAIAIFSEWFWKKVCRPIGWRLGWIKPKTVWIDQ